MAMANIIGDNVKTLRDDMGFSQSTIARFLNVDQSLISKVEKGARSREYIGTVDWLKDAGIINVCYCLR